MDSGRREAGAANARIESTHFSRVDQATNTTPPNNGQGQGQVTQAVQEEYGDCDV